MTSTKTVSDLLRGQYKTHVFCSSLWDTKEEQNRDSPENLIVDPNDWNVWQMNWALSAQNMHSWICYTLVSLSAIWKCKLYSEWCGYTVTWKETFCWHGSTCPVIRKNQYTFILIGHCNPLIKHFFPERIISRLHHKHLVNYYYCCCFSLHFFDIYI